MLNSKGIKFIAERVRPLAVNNVEEAAKVLHEALEKRRKAIEQGNSVPNDESFAAHLAWIIGFDTLTEDRTAIHQLVDKLVEDE